MSPGNNFGWEFFFIKIKNKQKKKKREKAVKIIKLPQTITLWFCLTRLWMRPNQTHFKNSPRLHRQGLNFYHLKYKQTLAKAQSSSLDLHCFFGFISIQSVVPERGFFFLLNHKKTWSEYRRRNHKHLCAILLSSKYTSSAFVTIHLKYLILLRYEKLRANFMMLMLNQAIRSAARGVSMNPTIVCK